MTSALRDPGSIGSSLTSLMRITAATPGDQYLQFNGPIRGAVGVLYSYDLYIPPSDLRPSQRTELLLLAGSARSVWSNEKERKRR